MCDSCGNNGCSCNPILVEKGDKGDKGDQGIQGIQGYQGWSTLLGLIQNNGSSTGTGSLFALQFTSWTGGAGTAPTNPISPNIYMQADGTFGALASAVNLMGPQGISIVWKGTFASPPSSPQLDWAYRDSSLKMARIWDGTTWQEMVEDGLSGGTGTNGISILWLGTFNTPPVSPTLNNAYRDTSFTPPKSRLWNGTIWVEMNQDGANGTNGTNGTNGFMYETVDGNGIPAQANGPYQTLRRKSDNTGYEFVTPLQLKVILNQTF